MEAFKYDPLKKLVFMDDTVCTGDALEEIKKDFPEMFTACVFASNQAKEKVDIYADILPIPHILEWHFFNSVFVENTLFDLDGIFAPEVPIEVCTRRIRLYRFYRKLRTNISENTKST